LVAFIVFLKNFHENKTILIDNGQFINGYFNENRI